VVPTGIAFDDFSAPFFAAMTQSGSLLSLYDFENRQPFFPSIDNRMRFCLLTLTGRGTERPEADYVFYASRVADLAEPQRHFSLSAKDIALLNPNTRTCPTFRSRQDAELARTLYLRNSVFVVETGDEPRRTWDVQFARIFNIGHEGDRFMSVEQLNPTEQPEAWVPLYEGKMFGAYNHRGASVKYVPQNRTRPFQPVPSDTGHLANPGYMVSSQFYLPRAELAARLDGVWRRNWLLCAKDVTSSTNERTVIAAILPPVATSYSVRTISGTPLTGNMAACLLAMLNGYVYDWVIRQFLGGLHLQDSITKQASVLGPQRFCQPASWAPCEVIAGWVARRVLELSYTAWDLQPFAADCGYDGPPFTWGEARRFLIRCELDAALFHLYLGTEGEWLKSARKEMLGYFPTPRHAVEYIMETFPIAKRKDTQAHGHYRSKDTILEIYNEMGEAQSRMAAASTEADRRAAAYKTRLDPPPGPPTDSAGRFIPMAQWDAAIWRRYKNVIHLPKELVRMPSIDVAAVAATTYPSTAIDNVVCAVAMEAVAQAGQLSSLQHLELALLATHPAWCKAFLANNDSKALDRAVAAAPSELVVTAGTSIRWADSRDYLERREALAVAHGNLADQPIRAGKALAQVRKEYPHNVSSVVELGLKALGVVRAFRDGTQNATPKQRHILAFFQQSRVEYGLTGS
jgi:hypothetical protein